jgi:hypothetical protein
MPALFSCFHLSTRDSPNTYTLLEGAIMVSVYEQLC